MHVFYQYTSGLSQLLHIVTDASLGQRSRVKWLVTSPEEQVEPGRHNIATDANY